MIRILFGTCFSLPSRIMVQWKMAPPSSLYLSNHPAIFHKKHDVWEYIWTMEFLEKNTNNKLVVYRSSIQPAGEDPGRNDVKLRMIIYPKHLVALKSIYPKTWKDLPSQSLTWNLKMTPWNRRFRTWKPSFLGSAGNRGRNSTPASIR